jgi:hypothetical protein
MAHGYCSNMVSEVMFDTISIVLLGLDSIMNIFALTVRI